MKTRVFTAIIMVALMVPFFVFGDTPALPSLMAFFSAVGVIELCKCIGVRIKSVIAVIFILISAGMPFILRYSGNTFGGEGLYGIALIAVVGLILSVVLHKKYDITQISTLILFTAYISFGFSAVAKLRTSFDGVFMVYMPFIVSWTTDTFAYFSGMLLGKRKLIPEVSPKKTVEGAIGGTLCSVILSTAALLIYGHYADKRANIAVIVAVCLVLSVVSQLGDLIMSLLKRKYGVKDYGKLFPGHGGVLDRFDSVILVSSVLLLITGFFTESIFFGYVL